MGLLTALAIGGLTGALAASTLKKKKTGATPALAPAPSSLAVPAPPLVNPAEDNATALAAGEKQRKRAALGNAGTRMIGGTGAAAKKFAPKTLIGGY